MTGTHLSQQVYALLTYIQATQSQTLLEQNTTAKNKAKDKKKVPKGQNLPGKVIRSAPCTRLFGRTFVSHHLTIAELVRIITTEQ